MTRRLVHIASKCSRNSGPPSEIKRDGVPQCWTTEFMNACAVMLELGAPPSLVARKGTNSAYREKTSTHTSTYANPLVDVLRCSRSHCQVCPAQLAAGRPVMGDFRCEAPCSGQSGHSAMYF